MGSRGGPKLPRIIWITHVCYQASSSKQGYNPIVATTLLHIQVSGKGPSLIPATPQSYGRERKSEGVGDWPPSPGERFVSFPSCRALPPHSPTAPRRTWRVRSSRPLSARRAPLPPQLQPEPRTAP